VRPLGLHAVDVAHAPPRHGLELALQLALDLLRPQLQPLLQRRGGDGDELKGAAVVLGAGQL